MKRILLLWLLVGPCGVLSADDVARPATPRGPAWLYDAPPQRVYRTQYPQLPPPGSETTRARGAMAEAVDPRPLVWVLDGAGDFRGCSSALVHASGLAGNPVEVASFAWSHGYWRLLLDQVDTAHTQAQGERLAAKIRERQAKEPGRRVVVVAHSAGSAVALAACDALPPDAIDRVILLAPAVSTGYDVRAAARAAREGMDVFCSKKDWLALGFVTRVVGTTDRRWGPAAGRYGFQLASATEPADLDADRLRQHHWTSEMARTGHTGGHYGTYAPGFILTYLFPMIGVSR